MRVIPNYPTVRLNHCDDERCSRFGTRRRLSHVFRKCRFWVSRVMLRVAVALYDELAREYVTRAARDAEVDPAQKFSFPAGSGHWNVVLPVHAVASRGFEIPGIKLGLKPGKCEFEMLPPDVRGPDLPSA
ncbi:hypothetical protein ALC53_01013 [Atta colombica]|uniref:Uncharacterized protein n=1 Tax=Atta colombica TaxID=520822 RepID=A0A195BVF0_9HYME|nr:hypothetical protein ALC53_01013 [Atta colombica]